uniref:C-type lectin domain-containing protein n=1 Tax=Anabas testudineus TaxID=64144 RepID=A0A3Q1H449_ANATE
NTNNNAALLMTLSTGSQQEELITRSKVTERVTLLILCVLLAAAVIGLGVVCEFLRLNPHRLTSKLNLIFSVSTAQLKLINFNFLTVNFLLNNLLDNCNLYSNLLKDDTCPKCEEGWELHGGKCYYFSTNKSTWDQSRDDCRHGGGDLVKIDSREEQVENTMNDDEDKFWIGLTDSKEEDKWLWVDDSPLNTSLTFWISREPDNWPGNNNKVPEGEDCARMGERGGADDLKCCIAVNVLAKRQICLQQQIVH